MVKSGGEPPGEVASASSSTKQPPPSPEWVPHSISRPKMKRAGTPFQEKARRALKQAGFEAASEVSRVKKKMVFEMAEKLLTGIHGEQKGSPEGGKLLVGTMLSSLVQLARPGTFEASAHPVETVLTGGMDVLVREGESSTTPALSSRNDGDSHKEEGMVVQPTVDGSTRYHVIPSLGGDLDSFACDNPKEISYNPTLVLHESVNSILGKRDNSSLCESSHVICPLLVNGEQPMTGMGDISHFGAEEVSPEMSPEPASVQFLAEKRKSDDPKKIAAHATGNIDEGAAGKEAGDESSKGADFTSTPVNLQSGKVQGLGTAGSYEGIPSLSFSNEETKVLANKIGYAIIGKFSHSIPLPYQIQKCLANIKFVDGFKWKSMNAKHILIQFRDESDYVRMLSGPNGSPVWYVDNHPMRVFKWTPDFDTFFESPIAAVWCKVIGLPIHLYDQSALIAIGKLLGKPMLADHATIHQTRLTFARICVEIDISHPQPEEIILNILGKETRYKVVWDRIPTYCVECKHVGHVQDECLTLGKKKPTTKVYNYATGHRRPNSRSSHIRREWRPKGSKADNPIHQPDQTSANKEELERGPSEVTKETVASTSLKATKVNQVQVDEDGFQLVTRRKKGKMNFSLHHPQEGPHKAPYLAKPIMGGNVATVSFGDTDMGVIDPGGSSSVCIS